MNMLQAARRAVIASVSLVPMVASAQECPEDRVTAQIIESLEAAEAAFSELDVDGFKTATDQAAKDLPCVREVFPRILAARYHRFVGLRAFVDREQAKAVSAFAAARTIEPDYSFPESFIPSGNPVMNSYLALDVAVDEWVAFAAPTEGSIQLDGRLADQRSTRFPHLFQYLDKDGAVASTVYVFPEERLPHYPGAVEVPDEVANGAGEGTVTLKSGPNTPLLVSSGVALLGSIILYSASSSSLVEYNSDEMRTIEDLDKQRRRTNTAMIASAGLGTVSVGLGASAFLVARW